MNDEDNKLYESLVNLKNRLQNEGNDSLNNRKPSVISDESLKLLVKYKPTNKHDLDNISGIGEQFIEHYGDIFIEEIKKFKETQVVTITEAEKIILSKLENRLVNINKRNRLLYSGKVNKDYGIDLYKLIPNINEIEEYLISRESKTFKLIDFNEYDDDKLKPLLKIMRQASKIEVENGNNELYIAYPFVQGMLEKDNFNIKAPLMLFPVKLERTQDKINLRNDFTRDIIYNTTLILANNKFNGKNEVLPDNAIDEFNSDNYINDMVNYYNDNKFYVTYHDVSLEPFLENKASEFPSYKAGELEVKKYMILGIYSTYVTSMYEDFHKMIEENNVTNLIKELLWGIDCMNEDVKLEDDTPEENEFKDTIEDEIKYINELDFSQENVLKEINHNDAIVVQGPPGTGKSQTITSIISQCVLDNKRVLMVSEKKTALDVIYSRLGDLSKFAIIIDDVENKQSFYDQMNSILNTMNTRHSLTYEENENDKNTIDKIKDNIKTINYDIECLNLVAHKVYDLCEFDTSMYNVYNVCKKINVSDSNELNQYNYVNKVLSENIKALKYPELTNIKNNLDDQEYQNNIVSYVELIRNNKYLENFKNNLTEFDLIELNNKLNELKGAINNYNQESFIKKMMDENKVKQLLDQFIANYFDKKDDKLSDELLNNINSIDLIVTNYNDFVNNKYIYDKLSPIEKEYALIAADIKSNFNISFSEANNLIYNTILYNVINNFEKENTNVTNYISNFDNIRNDIRKNIVLKKELTRKLAFNELLSEIKKLNDNNKISKIEEMCNRKRKMSLNKYMDKFKLEMLDSVRIWLMTPEVVSDILPFEKNLFDLLVFDEASQLYVEKAIPAIYRATKVVVAGDQKQLKPSSLGVGRVLDEIDEDEISDGFLEYESLLDAARYKYKHTMLNYHYRAKYDELISFSNYAFYNGKLMVTSVSNRSDEKPIERIKVPNGKWIDKKNREEAEEVVRLVKEILHTRKNNETIGVITFNSSQMNLIDDLIDKEKMTDPEFGEMMLQEENRFNNGENISFFVKNIETVQGDERDIIIFCIGYAKNEVGKVAINFGWLNQDGGENRLNVAISRAKEKIYVITSIEPDELNVEGTKNNGPKLFRAYLEYVKALSDGNTDLASTILTSLLDRSEQDSANYNKKIAFENDLCTKLEQQGYKVETQYGVGGYKIDIVLKDKDDKNILGIEIDGRLYDNTKFARERDYHRQKYLESRGWNIYRIWSSNWWKNADLEMTKINNYINKLNSKGL